MKLRFCVASLALLASVGLDGSGVGWASTSEEALEPSRTPPRLSLVSGEVSFWRPGADDWSTAHINLPLAPGDALYTGEGANAELQIGGRAFVRAGELTQLRLDDQEIDFLQLTVTTGHLALDLRTLRPGYLIEIDTPNAAIVVEREGYYRLRVSGDDISFSSRRGGQATIRLPHGQAIVVSAGERVLVEGDGDPKFRVVAAPDLDIWDRWNYERTDQIVESRSRRYVSEDVYGLDELDRYGTWQQTAAYGAVWVPAAIPLGWVPYSTGRWIWDPYYGWTWLDDSPWGWAPYHYGRWVYISGYWAWAPGPIVVRPYYAPALVAFFGGSGVGVHVSVSTPLVGWVALGWGEPLIPWWGRPGFIGRPCWYGWAGPRIVHHQTVVNVNKIHVYRNARVPNAVLALDRDRFGRGWHRPRRLGAAERDRLGPVRGSPGVTPVSASLAPSERRGRRPPAEIVRRSVLATRRPSDPSARLHAEGTRLASVEGGPPRRFVGEPRRKGLDESRWSDRSERARRRTMQSEQSWTSGKQPPRLSRRQEKRPTESANAVPERPFSVRELRGAKKDRSERPERAFRSAERRDSRRADRGGEEEKAHEQVRPPQASSSVRPHGAVQAPTLRSRGRSHEGPRTSEPNTNRPPIPEPPRSRTVQPRGTVGLSEAPLIERRERLQAARGAARLRDRSRSEPPLGNVDSSGGGVQRGRLSARSVAPASAPRMIEQSNRAAVNRAFPPAMGSRAGEPSLAERSLLRQIPTAASPGAASEPRFERRPRGSFAPATRAGGDDTRARGQVR